MSIRLWFFWVRRRVRWTETLWIVDFKLFKFRVLVDNDFKGIVSLAVPFSENDAITLSHNNRAIGTGRNNFPLRSSLTTSLVLFGPEAISRFTSWNFNLMPYLLSKVPLGSAFFLSQLTREGKTWHQCSLRNVDKPERNFLLTLYNSFTLPSLFLKKQFSSLASFPRGYQGKRAKSKIPVLILGFFKVLFAIFVFCNPSGFCFGLLLSLLPWHLSRRIIAQGKVCL